MKNIEECGFTRINPEDAVEYKQDDWNPWDYHKGLCGIGYSGMKMNTEMRHSVSYYRWKNMIQRCYDKKETVRKSL